jgi:undecaprenyl-diphosphatase
MPLTPFDVGLARQLRVLVPNDWAAPMRAVSYAGSPLAMAVVLVIVALLLLARRRWIALGAWISAFVGVALLDVMLKALIGVGTPLRSGFLHGQTLSFPSGHAMGALVGYGMLAHLTVTGVRRALARTLVITVATLLVVSIGASRLYLGAHYFSDAIAGLAAGLTWLTACITGLELAKRHRGPPVDQAHRLAA